MEKLARLFRDPKLGKVLVIKAKGDGGYPAIGILVCHQGKRLEGWMEFRDANKGECMQDSIFSSIKKEDAISFAQSIIQDSKEQ